MSSCEGKKEERTLMSAWAAQCIEPCSQSSCGCGKAAGSRECILRTVHDGQIDGIPLCCMLAFNEEVGGLDFRRRISSDAVRFIIESLGAAQRVKSPGRWA
ncbi:MAG: hypothetical protein LBU32_00240 [Clostridiales bacterium]|nr:hypothetical protein [Clostridiales bacterium]